MNLCIDNWYEILSFLTVFDAYNLLVVSKEINKIVDNDQSWKILYRKNLSKNDIIRDVIKVQFDDRKINSYCKKMILYNGRKFEMHLKTISEFQNFSYKHVVEFLSNYLKPNKKYYIPMDDNLKTNIPVYDEITKEMVYIPTIPLSKKNPYRDIKFYNSHKITPLCIEMDVFEMPMYLQAVMYEYILHKLKSEYTKHIRITLKKNIVYDELKPCIHLFRIDKLYDYPSALVPFSHHVDENFVLHVQFI